LLTLNLQKTVESLNHQTTSRSIQINLYQIALPAVIENVLQSSQSCRCPWKIAVSALSQFLYFECFVVAHGNFHFFRIINRSHCNTFWCPIRLLNELLLVYRKYLVFVFSWKPVFVKRWHHRICLISTLRRGKSSALQRKTNKIFRHQTVFSEKPKWIFPHISLTPGKNMFASVPPCRPLSLYGQSIVLSCSVKTKILFHSFETEKLFEMTDYRHSDPQKKNCRYVCVF